jgi:hypothetical protein
MASEIDSAFERSYRYQASWGSLGCACLLLLTFGSTGVALVSYGIEQIGNGQMFLGVSALIIGGLTGLSLIFLLFGFVVAFRAIVNPSQVRLSTSALHLPTRFFDGLATRVAEGAKPDSSEQPEEIPYRAIRWIRREKGLTPESDRLMIVHELSSATLEIRQSMMRPDDFDELEMILRTAVPDAFAAAPPVDAEPPSEE